MNSPIQRCTYTDALPQFLHVGPANQCTHPAEPGSLRCTIHQQCTARISGDPGQRCTDLQTQDMGSEHEVCSNHLDAAHRLFELTEQRRGFRAHLDTTRASIQTTRDDLALRWTAGYTHVDYDLVKAALAHADLLLSGLAAQHPDPAIPAWADPIVDHCFGGVEWRAQ